jgi:hypothetical protein
VAALVDESEAPNANLIAGLFSISGYADDNLRVASDCADGVFDEQPFFDDKRSAAFVLAATLKSAKWTFVGRLQMLLVLSRPAWV